MALFLRCLTTALLSIVTGAAHAQFEGFGFGSAEEEFGDSRDQVAISTIASAKSVAPGGDIVVGVVFTMDEGWHIWPVEGDDGEFDVFDSAIRTSIAIPAAEVGAIKPHVGFATWPIVHGVKGDLGDGEKTYGVYEGRVVVFVPVTIEADAKEGTYELEFVVQFQSCDEESCAAPATAHVEALIEVSASGTSGEVPEEFRGFDGSVFAKIRAGDKAPELIEFNVFSLEFSIDVAAGGGFLLLLLVAALGGFLLNLTPCVLPVIPLKIMGLSAAAGNRLRCFQLGVSMSLGVVFFWMVLGGLIAGVKSFETISQLFQYPVFTISVGVVIAVMAVGMAGFFTIKLPSKVYSVQTNHESLSGSFLFGIMTAVLSTPCTAPLMGAAAAWATTQSPGTVLEVFAAIGSGMAAPYLILSAFPAIVEKMPRTGPASELVKQVMGLLLLAAGVYFVGAGLSGLMMTPPDPPSHLYWWVVAIIGVVAGAWLAAQTFRITTRRVPRGVFGILGLVIALASGLIGARMTSKGPIDWVYYTPERFAEAVANDQIILLDFTAEWCLNCKTLEATSLSQQAVVDLTKTDGIVPMKIDITGDNPDGRAKMAEANRLTIPLLVVYGKGGHPVFKSAAYTGNQVVEALNEARATFGASSGP
jgi:thiol:disulfide interchange protein DsbD